MEPWIETYSGKYVNLLDPTEESIEVYDIAHALSMQCRFGGHSEGFYSVAEHSVLVSLLVSPENRLAALFHDSAEAYLGDVVSPLKERLTEYKGIELCMLETIASKFSLDWPFDEEIKRADRAQLKTEAKYLLPSGGKDWNQSYFGDGSIKGKIPKCLQPIEAKQLFLTRFWELSDKPVVEQGISPIWMP